MWTSCYEGFFVSQGTEKGLIQLTDDYDGDVEEDLNRACLEVAKDDPLGAYAVDFIKNDCTKVLTTYEATITISYRRTREQIRSLVNVTGTSAIRDEVRAALADFQSEVALRVGYFTESADSIAALVRQAYYDEPAGALGMPEFTVSLYPASGGQQRIVEVLLTYPEDTQALRQKSDDLQSTADALVLPLRPPIRSRKRGQNLLHLLIGQGTGKTVCNLRVVPLRLSSVNLLPLLRDSPFISKDPRPEHGSVNKGKRPQRDENKLLF